MKKTRILSMLLAAMLTVSSLPVATAAADAPVGEDAATGIAVGTDVLTLATSAPEVSEVEENTYLHLYDRVAVDGGGAGCASGFGYMGTFDADKIYFLSFDLRLSNDNSAAGDIPAGETDKTYFGSSEYNVIFHNIQTSFKQTSVVELFGNGIRETGSGKGGYTGLSADVEGHTANPTIKDGSTVTSLYTTATLATGGNGVLEEDKITATTGATQAVDSKKNTALKPSSEWKHYEFAFQPYEDVTENGYICVYRRTDKHGDTYRSDVPLDIDNFRIWYYDEEGDPVDVVTQDSVDGAIQDFEGIDNVDSVITPSGSSRVGKFFPANGAWGNNTSAKLKLETEKDYISIPASGKTASTSYTYGEDGLALDGGIYELTGEARLDFYSVAAKAATGEDHKANLKVTAVIDGKDVSSTVEITPEWGELAPISVFVPNGSTAALTEVKIEYTDDTEATLKTIELRDLSFKKIDDLSVAEEEVVTEADVVYAIDAGSLVQNDGAQVGRGYPASYAEGNKYLHVSGRFDNADGIKFDFGNVINASEQDYQIKFKFRATDNLIDLWESGLTSTNLIDGSGMRVNAHNNTTVLSKNYNNTGWTEVTVSVNDTLKGYTDFTMYGLYSGAQSNNFDVDDVEIYYYNAAKGQNVIVYSENFDDEAVGVLSEKLAASYSVNVLAALTQNTGVERPYDVEIEVAQDMPYFTATGVTELKYAVSADEPMVLAPGKYTVHGEFYYPNYDGARIALAMAVNSSTGANAGHYFTKNTNNFNVTATVETDGDPITTNTITVDYNWTDCAFTFEVTKETPVKSITFNFTDGNGESSTTVSYRNIYLEGVYPDESDKAMPNIGIIMMMLLKKNAAAGGESAEPEVYTGDVPVIISFRNAEDTAKNGILYVHKNPVTESGIWEYNADELAIELKDTGDKGEGGNFLGYRFMPRFSAANSLPEGYNYAVLVYKTTASKWDMKLTNNGSQADKYPVETAKAKADKWLATEPVDLTIHDSKLVARYNKPMWATWSFATSDKDARFFVKELAFFTSEEDAEAWYRDLDAYVATTDAALTAPATDTTEAAAEVTTEAAQ